MATMTHQQFIDQLKPGDPIVVKARRGALSQAILAGFEGVFMGFKEDNLNRPACEVRNTINQAVHVVLARCLAPPRSKSIVVVGDDGEVKRRRKKGGVRIAKDGSPRQPQDCKCGCGEKTGGGNFRPGHDARLVSLVVKGERKVSELKPFPKLMAKYERKKEAK